MNKHNFRGAIAMVAWLACAGCVAWFGFNLVRQYRQIQQFERGNELLAQGKYDSAIATYDRALTTNRVEYHSILINRGYAFLGVNRYREMLESCSQAVSIAPNVALAWNCQGEAFYYLAQYQDALIAFDRAIELEPQEVTFWLNKAQILSLLNQNDRALKANNRAIELSTKNNRKTDLALAFEQKGRNLLDLGRYDLSLTAFENSLGYEPDNLLAQQGQGIAYYELKKYQKAIAIFESILLSDRFTPEQQAISWLYLGTSYCQTEQITAAEAAFQEVLELTEDPPSREIAQKGCGIR